MRQQQEAALPVSLFFRWFESSVRLVLRQDIKIVRILIRIQLLVIPLLLRAGAATGWIYQTTPQGFIPEEDQATSLRLLKLHQAFL